MIIQGVPRNMTVAMHSFVLSSSIDCVRCLRLFFSLFYKSFTQNILLRNQFYFTAPHDFFIILFGIKQLTKLWKNCHLKEFTSCIVSWDNLYLILVIFEWNSGRGNQSWFTNSNHLLFKVGELEKHILRTLKIRFPQS